MCEYLRVLWALGTLCKCLMDEPILLRCVLGNGQPELGFKGEKGKLLGMRNFRVGMEGWERQALVNFI